MVFFSLFCVFFNFAQGFTLKMQLFEQKINKTMCFVMLFASNTLKTFILDRLLSENTIKPMAFQFFRVLDQTRP